MSFIVLMSTSGEGVSGKTYWIIDDTSSAWWNYHKNVSIIITGTFKALDVLADRANSVSIIHLISG